MSWWQRRYRRNGRPTRLFTQQARREMVKGGGGALLTVVGTGIGSLLGLLGTRFGLPPQTSAVSGVLGTIVGETAKGHFIGTVDAVTVSTNVGDLKALLRLAGGWVDADKKRLGSLVGNMRDSHRSVLLILTGGRPDRLTQIGRYLAEACGAIDGGVGLAQDVIEGLDSYRARL